MTRQSGNVLFLILIAVALFAALSYAVTRSSRGGEGSATKESLQTQVALFEGYGVSLAQALQRMHVSQGIDYWKMDFSKDGVSVMTANGACTTAACKVFDPAGGAVSLPPLKGSQVQTDCGDAASWRGRLYIRNIGVKGIGVDNRRDLVLIYPGIEKKLCRAINDKNGVVNPASGAPVEADNDNGGFADYDGTMSGEVNLDSNPELGVSIPSAAGKRMFCSEGGLSGCPYLYYVLVER